MFTALTWFCFIGALVCSPGLLSMGTDGITGMIPAEQKRVLGFVAFAVVGAFLGFQGVRNDERGRFYAKLGMFANLLAILVVVGLEVKARMR